VRDPLPLPQTLEGPALGPPEHRLQLGEATGRHASRVLCRPAGSSRDYALPGAAAGTLSRRLARGPAP